ncbi:unnamed protein product [Blepharisma stoltei]|uniref:Uncharacterized protein n=1 Tax=Blepharisma stoltei TaxID=1481888 RepID=A0AAU9J413_9CILI|nr:unnamed protein product [Blepharisma stoltei]
MDNLSLLAVGNLDGSIMILSIIEDDNQPPYCSYHYKLLIFCHSLDIYSLSWSDSNNLLASGSADGTLKILKINPEESKGGDAETAQSLEDTSFTENLVWSSKASDFIHAISKR